MIRSFGDKDTERLWTTGSARRLAADTRQRTIDKLQMVNAAAEIEDLRAPPSNHLEKLRGDRQGWWSIRINKQWCIIFQFTNGDAHKVAVIDYH